jgi:hypothetical protein
MPEKRLVWHQYFYCFSSASIFWLQGQSETTSRGLVLKCPALIYIQIFHNAGIIYCCCNVDGYYQLGINWFSGLMQINPIHRSGKNCVLISLWSSQHHCFTIEHSGYLGILYAPNATVIFIHTWTLAQLTVRKSSLFISWLCIVWLLSDCKIRSLA